LRDLRQTPIFYLRTKLGLKASITEFVRVYQKVVDDLRAGQRILDWGCRHAPFAALVHAGFGAEVELHGCDVCTPDEYAAFHAACRLNYQQIQHPWLLDYPDAYFDVVLASGALEHVPNDHESLTELWRVLKPDGSLLITHLPNRTSWTEYVSRRLFPDQAHRRRYSLADTRRALLHRGFDVALIGYHQLAPSSLPMTWRSTWMRSTVQNMQFLNRLEAIWPFRLFAATLWCVARKRQSI
jgi:SAM-dependent methyltransferase